VSSHAGILQPRGGLREVLLFYGNLLLWHGVLLPARSKRCCRPGIWSVCSSGCWWPFFHGIGSNPVANGQRFGRYRLSDARVPRAAITMAPHDRRGDFGGLVWSSGVWPEGLRISNLAKRFVWSGALLLSLQQLNRCLFPFSAWFTPVVDSEGPIAFQVRFLLRRCLSCFHLGAYCLLRLSPINSRRVVDAFKCHGNPALGVVSAGLPRRFDGHGVQSDSKLRWRTRR